MCTVADLCGRSGIPPERIRLIPPPGAATEQDLLDLADHADCICELIDGVLVQKTAGFLESVLAGAIGASLHGFAREHKLGIVLGAGGPLRILPGQVRIPDASFVSWKRFPGGKLPDVPIPAVVPDLAVEVLPDSNTPGEMRRKLRDYFAADVRLAWYIDPRTRTATVYTALEQSVVLGQDDVLTGGDVLPGFELPLRQLFAEIEGQ
jgi:Uma2 family endonuclease